MANREQETFPPDFRVTLRGLVGVHQSIYPLIPPQGIYFEALVEEAFRRIRKPFDIVKAGGRNQPRHDLLVDDIRISIKTETGNNTKPNQITITKLCTTEREPWEPRVLIGRVMEHLSRYDVVLMFRAVWSPKAIHYQLVEIPVVILRSIGDVVLHRVGRRRGRQSLGADVCWYTTKRSFGFISTRLMASARYAALALNIVVCWKSGMFEPDGHSHFVDFLKTSQ